MIPAVHTWQANRRYFIITEILHRHFPGGYSTLVFLSIFSKNFPKIVPHCQVLSLAEALSLKHHMKAIRTRYTSRLKPVTDEQVFYDKFLCDKFYLPSARVYMQQILYDKFYFPSARVYMQQFFIRQFLFTGVNVSTSFII